MMENEKLVQFKPREFAKHHFVAGSGESIRTAADYARTLFQHDIFYNQMSILEVPRAFYTSKRIPRRAKKFLDKWYAIWMLAIFAI